MTQHRLKLSMIAAASVLALAACKEDGYGGQARIAVPDPTPPMYLSDALALPYADSAPVDWYAPDQGYRWAERAYAVQRAFYDEPPDYGFYDDGLEPLVWETADDWAMYAEPWSDEYRYYYYEPGAAYPYFIRDDEYGYAYDPRGVLIAVIDVDDGLYLPSQQVYALAPVAGRYYTRGRELRNAALQAPRVQVTETVWRSQAQRIEKSARPWLRAPERDQSWRAWRAKGGEKDSRRFVEAAARGERIASASGVERSLAGPHGGGFKAEKPRHEDRAFARQETRGRAARPAEAYGRQATFVERPHGGPKAQAERGPGGGKSVETDDRRGGPAAHAERGGGQGGRKRAEAAAGPQATWSGGPPARVEHGGGRGGGWKKAEAGPAPQGGGGGGAPPAAQQGGGPGGGNPHGPPQGGGGQQGGGGNPHKDDGGGQGGNPHGGGNGHGKKG